MCPFQQPTEPEEPADKRKILCPFCHSHKVLPLPTEVTTKAIVGIVVGLAIFSMILYM